MLTSSLRSNNDKSRNINNEKDDQLKDDDEANKKSERLRNRVRRAFVFLVKASIAFASSLRENATNDIKIIFQCVNASIASHDIYCMLLVHFLAFEFACASSIKRDKSDDESKDEKSENH